MWCVYFVRCSDDSLYCGITSNLLKRIDTHNAGKGSKYTRSRKPVALVWHEEVCCKSIALKKEYALKKLNKCRKESLVRNGHKSTQYVINHKPCIHCQEA